MSISGELLSAYLLCWAIRYDEEIGNENRNH